MTVPTTVVSVGSIEDARLKQAEAELMASRAESQAFADAKKIALETGVPMVHQHTDAAKIEADHVAEVKADNLAERAVKQDFADAKQVALDTGVPMDAAKVI